MQVKRDNLELEAITKTKEIEINKLKEYCQQLELSKRILQSKLIEENNK